MDPSFLLWQPAAVIALLMFCALLVWICGDSFGRAASVLTVAALTGGIIILFPLIEGVLAGTVYRASYDILPPFFLSFAVDKLSLGLALLFQFLGAVLAVFTGAYPLGRAEARFKSVFVFVLACSVGVVLAGDLISLFLFFEAMSILFFVLVIHNRDSEAVAASLKMLYMSIGASVLYFMALAAVYQQGGRFAWTEGGFMQAGPYTLLAFIGFATAFGMKAGLFPLHLWMPDAYSSAPVPAATLSSMIMLKTGTYGMIRIFYYVFGADLVAQMGWQNIIMVLALISIIYGSTCAFAAQDLMRRLAYSGVAQLGYIMLGISLLTPDSLTGGLYHILSHAMMKGVMLLCAGAILVKTGKRFIHDLAGIGLEMPFTMTCFSLAALTAMGIPPMNIFISKWYLSLGALQAGKPFIIIILLVSSMLNAAYYLPIAFSAFFGERNRDLHATLKWDGIHPAMCVAMVILVAGCVGFTLGQVNIPLEWARTAVAALF